MGNQKGFILHGVLMFMMFFTTTFSVYFICVGNYSLTLKDYELVYNRLELEHVVISRINKEFYEFTNVNFNMKINESHIEVEYEDLVAKIMVSKGYVFNSCLYYNDPYGTIDNYQYGDDCH